MSGQRQDGFILVVVLGAVLALCALLFGFSQTTRTSLTKADGFQRSEQAWNAAWGGLQFAVALVRDVNSISTDAPSSNRSAEENIFSVGDANCSVVIAEENGLLNVNRLKTADGQLDRRHIDQFLRLIDVLNHQQKDAPPLGYGIVPALIDWTDTDDDVTCLTFVQHDNLGAENDCYQACTPPYPCRNGPVDTTEELLSVRGMTPEGFDRLRPFLTCVGDGQIDINAAPKFIIQSLSEQIDATLADMIVRQRQRNPFGSVADLRRVPGLTDNVCREIQSLITVVPGERFYRVTSAGRLQNHRCTIEALLRRNTQAETVDVLQYREF